MVTGGTGLLGRHLVKALAVRGHEPIVVSRKTVSGGQTWDSLDFTGVQGVIHLAGAGVFDKRWNAKYKKLLHSSRVNTKERLHRLMPAGIPLIQASAVGFYGLKPDGECSENRACGADFLAQLCQDWEEPVSRRHVCLRIGIVFSHDGGALEELRKLYRMRLGGKIAGGKQAFPWVHIDDVVSAFIWALEHEVSGTYNLASPGGVNQATLDNALGATWKVCHVLPTPGFGLRLVAGEAGKVLAGGQWIDSSAIQDAGFTFQYPELRGALQAIEVARQRVQKN